jgi:DNA-binding transcriptional MerR regulator
MTDAVRYAIGDLAELASVSRRTVRYYVQEGLLPAPLGVGRGNHYGQEHLDQLLRVKALQEAGHSLDEIKRGPGQRVHRQHRALPPETEPEAPVERTLWRRVSLARGVELHVASTVRLPSPGKLHDLARWCRSHLHPSSKDEDSDA